MKPKKTKSKKIKFTLIPIIACTLMVLILMSWFFYYILHKEKKAEIHPPDEELTDFEKIKNYWEDNIVPGQPSLSNDLDTIKKDLEVSEKQKKGFDELLVYKYHMLDRLFPTDSTYMIVKEDIKNKYPSLSKANSKLLKKKRLYADKHEQIFDLYLEAIGFKLGRGGEKIYIRDIKKHGKKELRKTSFNGKDTSKYSVYRFLMFVSRNYSNRVARQFLIKFREELFELKQNCKSLQEQNLYYTLSDYWYRAVSGENV